MIGVESFISSTPADVLRRCCASLLKAADWVEEDDGAEAVAMIHLVVTDIEQLVERLAEPAS